MQRIQEGIGEHGEGVSGPPWILGHRGAPREAPENTLTSLSRALELGLDGVEYDLQSCASGEPVLLHDETLDRTTDRSGPVSALTLADLARADAGGWFDRRFMGEPLPLLEEALGISAPDPGTWPMHMIELKDPGLAGEVARALTRLERPLPVRIASFHRQVLQQARDLGLPTMLLVTEPSEDDRRFVRDERLVACASAPGAWRARAGAADWACERWSWSVDEPEDLLEACRLPLAGFNTNEPWRALALRALVALTPDDRGGHPLSAPRLEVAVSEPALERGRHGAWSGRWSFALGIRNPFPFRVGVTLACAVRGGAFEVQGLPWQGRLEAGAEVRVPLELSGGSWSPGEDPALFARFAWQRGPGRAGEALVLDRPLARVRTLVLGRDARRVEMLCEHPGEKPATMVVQRKRDELLAWVEDAGGLKDLRAWLRLGHEARCGGHGVRLSLPEGFDRLPEGVDFCVGFDGRAGDGPVEERRLRRWAGGLPYGLGSGAPARLLGAARA
jgi:glycerophosphoryl diester phosphodiesterase